jgi:hypothetical protein
MHARLLLCVDNTAFDVYASTANTDTNSSRVFPTLSCNFCLPPTSWHRRSKSVFVRTICLLRNTSHETGHAAGHRSDISV